MNTPTSPSPRGRAALRWVINVVWIALWVVLYFLCIKVFGDRVALVGVLVLIVAMATVWYVTDQRDRQHPEQDA